MARPMRDFALEVYFSRWEFSSKYNLAGSDAESLSQNALLDLASAEDRLAYENLTLGYTETFGAPALRQEISKTYDTARAEHILCFAGAEEALYTAMKCLLSAQDHAIVVTPNYQAAETVPLSICEVTGVPLDAERDWDLDIERVRAALRANTKLLSINFPNNPTGKIIPCASFDALVDICRRHNMWLFSDEVYRLIERDESLRLPQAVDAYERAISLNVMSKAYGLAGLRIGWLACKDRDTLVRFERYKHFLSICNSGPSERLALIALKAKESILERNRKIVRENIEHYRRLFIHFRDLFDWKAPDGGCVTFIRYKGREGVEEFARRLVEEAGVLFLPASVYRSELSRVPADRFRVSRPCT
jgi:aspartate/methionine/tyrosine aminotransferase